MALTVARFLATTDALAASYLAAKAGLVATKARLVTLRGVVDGYNEADVFQKSIDGILASEAKNDIDLRAALLLADAFNGLDDDCAKHGVDNSIAAIKDAKSFAVYYQYGAGGPWTCFLAPDFALAYEAIFGSYPGAKLVYSPANADLGHRAVGGVFTAGTDIDTALYAGAALPRLTSATITGSGVVNVVGQAYDSGGTLRTGRTFSVAVSSDTTATLMPSVTGDVLTKVTDIVIPAGITVGTLTVIAAIPAGRSNPPS